MMKVIKHVFIKHKTIGQHFVEKKMTDKIRIKKIIMIIKRNVNSNI